MFVAGCSLESSSPKAKAHRRGDPTHLKFGETAHYKGHYGALEVTVSAPEAFDPSDDAQVFDNFANEVDPKPVNVFFTVSIKNVSKRTFDGHEVLTTKVEDPAGNSIVDRGIDGLLVDGLRGLAAGDSITVKDGWSLPSSADNIEYQFGLGSGIAEDETYYFK
jgi:hypothetical protein